MTLTLDMPGIQIFNDRVEEGSFKLIHRINTINIFPNNIFFLFSDKIINN
jgi:hypothetical protein